MTNDYKFNIQREAAIGLFALCIFGVLTMHIIPALLAGLLAFVVTRGLLSQLRKWDKNRKLLSHELLSGLVVGVGSFAAIAGISFLVARFLGGETLRAFTLTLADTITQAKHYLPVAVADYVPDSFLEMRQMAADALKGHANMIAGMGTHFLHSLVLTLIGWLVGVLAAVNLDAHSTDTESEPTFIATWARLWLQLAKSFKNIAQAQAKVASINAAMTAVFLMVVLPLLGWKLPYVKTLVLVTLVLGLLPVVGNLLSNALIFLLALSVAFPAAVVSLVFLVIIHKLEYFISARIQGHEMDAKTWELLIVLFSMELLFGPAGMVAAPVIYAFIKAEFKRGNWIVTRSNRPTN